MAIYDFKEFLTIDDVADYLRDKGVYDFDLSSSYDQQRLYDFIKELYQTNRVTPVFFHGTGSLKKHDAFDLDKDIRELKSHDYFICTNDMVKHFLKGFPSWLTFGDDYSKPFFRLYKDTSPHFLYVPEHIFDDEQVEVLFPKSELDALFNTKDDSQQQTADLQQENDRLQARIAELEQQLAMKSENATPANLTGLDKVNYDKQKAKQFAKIVAKSIWEMDSTKQIKTGDMVKFLLPLINEFDSQNLPDTDDSIKEWIKDVRPDYAATSGRPPNNAPKEIPLTFKK